MIATARLGRGMAHTDDESKKKQPHEASQILEMEDTIAEIAERLKQLRVNLQTGKMPTVMLMTGTFKFRARQCLKMAKKFLSEYDTQVTDYNQDRLGDRIKNERETRNRKRS